MEKKPEAGRRHPKPWRLTDRLRREKGDGWSCAEGAGSPRECFVPASFRTFLTAADALRAIALEPGVTIEFDPYPRRSDSQAWESGLSRRKVLLRHLADCVETKGASAAIEEAELLVNELAAGDPGADGAVAYLNGRWEKSEGRPYLPFASRGEAGDPSEFNVYFALELTEVIVPILELYARPAACVSRRWRAMVDQFVTLEWARKLLAEGTDLAGAVKASRKVRVADLRGSLPAHFERMLLQIVSYFGAAAMTADDVRAAYKSQPAAVRDRLLTLMTLDPERIAFTDGRPAEALVHAERAIYFEKLSHRSDVKGSLTHRIVTTAEHFEVSVSTVERSIRRHFGSPPSKLHL
ncbi:MAG: hypothetical protein ACSLFQ_01465 [Thermoanaerobaculia bacterium]